MLRLNLDSLRTHKKKIIYAILIFILTYGASAAAFPAARTVFVTANASPKKLPIYSVATDKPQLSVTFDAAWGADDTEDLLRILAGNDVKATFFLCGYWVDKYPDEVKKIYEAGHDIGNHGDTHAHGAKLSMEQNKNEIMGVHKKVYDLIGVEINLFRPPYGEYNDNVLDAAAAVGYYAIQWNIDSLDWKERGVEEEINQVLNNKNLSNGSIILFHNDTKYTPDALDSILKGLKQKGYEIVPVSQLIHKENYYMDHEGRQHLNK